MLERAGDGDPCATMLRISTAYGVSQRMRFDLTISEFTRTLTLGEELLVYDADTWRPYCHVEDISAAILTVLDAAPETVAGEVFNVGHSDENYTKRMVVEAVLEHLDGAGRLSFHEGGEDPRNYRVSFAKIQRRSALRPAIGCRSQSASWSRRSRPAPSTTSSSGRSFMPATRFQAPRTAATPAAPRSDDRAVAMRAAILAGGQGARLRPYTTVLPKPLVPVGERPILELIIRQLGRAGCDRLDLCVGHLGELIRAYLEESCAVPDGLSVTYHWEDEPIGTAGALHQLEPPQASFLVMNGDILTTLDYSDLMRFHEDQGAALTIATHHQAVELALGVIEGDGGWVSGYVEKPTLQYEVSMGIYVYSPRALARVPRRRFDFPELVLALIAAGEKVASYHFEGPWFDIGTPAEHERAVLAYTEDPSLFDLQG